MYLLSVSVRLCCICMYVHTIFHLVRWRPLVRMPRIAMRFLALTLSALH